MANPPPAARRRMRTRIHVSLTGSLLLFGMTGTVMAQRLPELLQQAMQSDPAVLAAASQATAAMERVNQALGAMGPTVQFTASTSGTRYREAPANGLRPFHGNQAALQVTQPLLRNSLYFGLQAASALSAQAEAQLALSKAESVQRFVEAVSELFKARDTLRFLRAQQISAAEQLAVARQTYRVGVSPLTDVRDAEAHVDAVAAALLGAEGELRLREQTLAEIAGPDSADLLRWGLDGRQLPTIEAPSILEWLADARTSSPQVQQALQALAAAEAEVRKAWQAHAPTADITYSYTRSNDTGTVTSIFPRRGESGTLGLNVTVPIYAGGTNQARVREAQALQGKAEADVEAARRSVSLAVRQAFQTTLTAVAQARGLETALKSQELALRAAQSGYRVGTKANADVLGAQSKLFDVRRDLSRARCDAWSGFIKLKVLTGQANDGDMAQLNGLLVEVVMPQMTEKPRPQP